LVLVIHTRPIVGALKKVALALVAFLLAAAAVEYVSNLRLEGDTSLMVRGASAALTCMQQGKWLDCPGVWHWPLLQYIPTLLLKAAHLDDVLIMRWLAVLNLVAFALLVRLCWRGLGKYSKGLALVFVGVLFSGPMLWYARGSFGETLAAFLYLALIVRCHERAPSWEIFAWTLLACISKETAFPFVLLSAFLANALAPQDSERSFAQRLRWRPLLLGVLVAMALNSGFNLFRFGSPLNTYLLNPRLQVPTFGIQLDHIAAIWFSPNSGVLFFWPTAFFLFAAGAALAIRGAWKQSARWGPRLKHLLPLGVVFAILFGITFGFSKWFSPFGWVAWGPRLELPWLAAAAYLVLIAYREPMSELLGRLFATKWRAAICCILWMAVSLPQLAILFRPEMFDAIFALDRQFSHHSDIWRDTTYYYAHLHHVYWRATDGLLLAFLPKKPVPFLYSLGFASLLAWGLSRIHVWARGMQPQKETASVGAPIPVGENSGL
jgi:hypothetical protein